MIRREFNECLEEAKKMFNLREISFYVSDVFYDEYGMVEKDIFMKALAYAAANGLRLTSTSIDGGLVKARNKLSKKERIKSECIRCSGDGAVVVDNYAYSCTCRAGGNYPNYPKYAGQRDTPVEISETEKYIIRKIDGYITTTTKDAKSIKEVGFMFNDKSQGNL